MCRSLALGYFVIALLTANPDGLSAFGRIRILQADNHTEKGVREQRIVDQIEILAEDHTTSHLVLAVNRDDVVGIYFWSENRIREGISTPSPRLRRILGQQVSRSDNLRLDKLVPRTEVATQAWRVTQNRQCRSHVILTWGFDKEFLPAAASEYYNLYVFTEDLQTGGVKLSWEEKNISRELQWFAVQDLNADGLVEIADIGRENSLAVLKIRTLTPRGEVSLIQKMEGYDIWVLPAHYIDNAAIIGVQMERFSLDERKARVRNFQWSATEQKFIPKP